MVTKLFDTRYKTSRSMKRSLTLPVLSILIIYSAFISNTWAHQGKSPLLLKSPFIKKSSSDELVLAPIDAETQRSQQLKKMSGTGVKTKTINYAVVEDISVNPTSHGYWEDIPGGEIWRLRVKSAGATDINFGFTKYKMPIGATLHIYDPVSGYYQGPYTAEHNYDHQQLWTPVTPGSVSIIEVFIPNGKRKELSLHLGHVGKGYQDIFNVGLSGIIKQGSCNIDVVCPEGDPWRDEIRSVGIYGLNGGTFCTGTLINNISQDFKPFFLTADHCGLTSENSPSVVAYWNFESPNCGDLDNGSLSQNTSGSMFRADNVGNDMTLIELNAQPLSTYNVHYAGWDARTNIVPNGSVGIHHPSTDEKAISFNDDALTSTSSCIVASEPDTHWRVDNWEQGTTEPGSSGSALFDPSTKRLVGYLSGGSASCSNTAGLDCYGKFSVGWTLGLSNWLDPNGTGALFIDGADKPNEQGENPNGENPNGENPNGENPNGENPNQVIQARLGSSTTSLQASDVGNFVFGKTEIPTGLTQLIVDMRAPETGDPDLYTRFSDQPTETLFDCRPFRAALLAESCIQESPTAGNHFWGVRAFSPYSGVIVDVRGIVSLGSEVTGLAESQANQFSIVELNLPEGVPSLNVMMNVPNSQQDPNLYVRFGAQPTLDQFDCRPFLSSGSSELCELSNPQPGIYYIGINSVSAYDGVSLMIEAGSPRASDEGDILDFLPAILSAPSKK